jgi:hypothetical protein
LYSSKNLITILHQHGFCASYDEVLMFERCAAITTNTELNIQPNSVVQYVADKADHNLRTIDGKGTFHGMGKITAITPSPPEKHCCVPRSTADTVSILSIASVDTIGIDSTTDINNPEDHRFLKLAFPAASIFPIVCSYFTPRCHSALSLFNTGGRTWRNGAR